MDSPQTRDRAEEKQPDVAVRDRPTEAAPEGGVSELGPIAQVAVTPAGAHVATLPATPPPQASTAAPPLRSIDVLALQHAAGNSAVAQLLAQRRPQPEQRIVIPDKPKTVEGGASEAPAPPTETSVPELPPLPARTSLGPTPGPATAREPTEDTAAEEDVRAPEAQAVMASVKAALSESQLGLARSVDAAVAHIDQTTQDQQKALDDGLALRLASVRETFGTIKSQVRAAVAGQVQHIAASSKAAQRHLDSWKAGATSHINAGVAAQQQRAIASGTTNGDKVRSDGEQSATNLTTLIQSSIARARSIGRVRATAKGSTDEITRAKAKVANDLTDETVAQVDGSTKDAADQLRGQGADIARQLTGQASGFAAQIAAQAPSMVSHVDDIGRSTRETISKARSSATESLMKLENQMVATLSRMEREIVRGLQRQAAATRHQLDAMKTRAQQTLGEQQASAQAAGRNAVGDFARALARTPLTPESTQALADETAATIQRAHLTAAGEARGSALQVAGQIRAAGTQGIADLTSADANGTSHARQVEQQANQQAAMIGRQSAAQLDTAVSQATAAGDQSVTELVAGVAQQVNDLDAQLSQVAINFNVSLGDQVTSAASKAAQPVNTLDGRIEQAQQKAEEQLSKSWLERQWDDLKELVSSPGFWVGLLVAVAVGALIILTAGAATPFVIMAAAVAAGAAGAAAGTIVSNIQHGKPMFENVLRNMLIGGLAGGVGAAVFLFGGGIIAGAELTGLAATAAGFAVLEVSAIAANTIANLLSGQPWDKNLLASMLLAPLLARLARAVGLEPELGVEEEGGGIPRVAVADLPPEVGNTLDLIDAGGPFPYARDGIPFGNREGLLPPRPPGYYREYTVPTPGAAGRGAQRIVTGAGGEAYYTPDHYGSFQRIR